MNKQMQNFDARAETISMILRNHQHNELDVHRLVMAGNLLSLIAEAALDTGRRDGRIRDCWLDFARDDSTIKAAILAWQAARAVFYGDNGHD